MSSLSDRWKRKYPRHWWALMNMPNGSFQNCIRHKLNTMGSLSEKQMAVLWAKAEELEDIATGHLEIPPVGAVLSIHATITKVEETEGKLGKSVLRTTFKSADGWTGRFDLHALKGALAVRLRSRTLPCPARLSGHVVWVRSAYVVFMDDRVEVPYLG